MANGQHDGINWHAFATVDKYSKEQVAWVREKIGREPKGADLKAWLSAPDLGTVEADGNLLVNNGLTRITNLITGGGGAAFNSTQGLVGVGSVSTAATTSDTALGGNGSSTTAWYQIVDSAPTTSTGQITAVSTFSTANANFAWNEWCWAIATGTITAGATLASVGTSPIMVNHKIAALGTKVSTATWVLTSTITLS